jgi:hypothetical protein
VIIGASLVLGAVSCMTDAGAPTAPAYQSAARRTESPASPTLLSCAATETQSTTGLLGLLGGVLNLGGTKLELPLLSILDPTWFQIVVPQSQYMEVEIHAVGLTSFLFRREVRVTIDYSRCSDEAIPDGAQLKVVYIDGATKAVLEDMGGTDDRASKKITFYTGHLSGYAVAY